MRLDNNGAILLESGDVVRYVWQLIGANQKVIDLAIHDIKQTLANDARFNYQGSEILWITDQSGFDYPHLAVYIQVRKGKTIAQPALAASLAPLVAVVIIVVALSTATAFVSCAVISYQHYLARKDELMTINGIVASDASDEVKKAALDAIKRTGEPSQQPGALESIGTGFKVAGSGVAIAAIAVAAIWGLSLMKGGTRSASLET